MQHSYCQEAVVLSCVRQWRPLCLLASNQVSAIVLEVTRVGTITDIAGLVQELVEIVGRSTGIALMAPPTDNDTAQQTLNTLLSAVNKKQKVCMPYLPNCVVVHVLHASLQALFRPICMSCQCCHTHTV